MASHHVVKYVEKTVLFKKLKGMVKPTNGFESCHKKTCCIHKTKTQISWADHSVISAFVFAT